MESFLLKQIKRHKLEKHVKFVGRLQSDRMCARFLKTHVFLCPSAIENSPNSVGEAMLLGVPVVSANVGGVHNLVYDGIDGFLYTKDKPTQLKDAILRILKMISWQCICLPMPDAMRFEPMIRKRITEHFWRCTVKLTIVSNYINHHQIPMANALYEKLGADFAFYTNFSDGRRPGKDGLGK